MPHVKQPVALSLGKGDALGAGDSYLVTDFLPEDLAKVAFENLNTEVKWQTMQHRGKQSFCQNGMICNFRKGGEVPRLVAVQGEVQEDGRYVRFHYLNTRR